MTSSLIAALLSGTWRESPPAPECSEEELKIIAPLLIASGGGALAFWKLRGTVLESSEAAQDLKQAYRLYTLHAAIHEKEIRDVLSILAQAGVEPILVKGWSMARLYPEAALRPYGDIDLFVRPDQYDAAREALATEEGRKVFVDLHLGADHLCDQPFEDLWARSYRVSIGKADSKTGDISHLPFENSHLTYENASREAASTPINGRTPSVSAGQDFSNGRTPSVADGPAMVRVLSNEDHLRILCVHFLHHGAWRPAALCDIGLMVEAYKNNFDWDVCLTTNQKRARWVECTIGLAHRLLGADISHTPIESSAKKLPRWLIPAVLKEWENPVSVDHVVPPPLADRLSHPIDTIKAIGRRWPPNPIQATIVMNGSFDDRPRIFYQASNFLSRTATFLRRRRGRR